jgi:hypothetical protein
VCATLTASGVACHACEVQSRIRRTCGAIGIVAAIGAAVFGLAASIPHPPARPEALLPDPDRIPSPTREPDEAAFGPLEAADAAAALPDPAAFLERARQPSVRRRPSGDAGGSP